MNKWHELTTGIRNNENGYLGIINPHVFFKNWSELPFTNHQYSLVKLYMMYDNHFSLTHEKVTTPQKPFMATIYKPRIPL